MEILIKYAWDMGAAALLLYFAFGGYQRGLIKVLGRFLSFVVSITLTAIFRPVVMKWLEAQGAIKHVQGWLMGNAKVDPLAGAVATPVPNQTPDFINQMVLQASGSLKSSVDTAMAEVYRQMAMFFFDILLLVALFFAVRFLLSLVTHILDKIASLPVLNGINKLLGGTVGLINGLCIVYIVCALLSFLSGTAPFNGWVAQVKQSVFLSYLYNQNLLLQLFFTH